MCLCGWGRTLPATRRGRRQEGARCALLLLSCINLLNFADRYVPSSVKGLVKAELQLTDLQTALPTTGMVLVYMFSAPAFGVLADRQIVDRRTILACAVAFWSAATALAGAARSLPELVVFRSLLGVGEAAYTTLSPALIADFFPLRDRNLALMVFYVCAPLGGALGFVAGSLLGEACGWRAAFLACGLPGLALACLLPALNDPARGVNDPVADAGPEAAEAGERRAGLCREFWDILSNPHWFCAAVGATAASFAIGGLAEWFQELTRRTYPGASAGQIGLALGMATMLGGICGTFLGGHAAEQFAPRWRSAHFLVPALFMLPSAAFCFLGVNVKAGPSITIFAFVLPMFVCFFTHSGPIYTAMVNCTPVHLRSRAMGLSIFSAHVLGDVISPPIVGAISDATGSLRTAMQILWIAVLVSALSWGLGYLLLSPLPQSADDKGKDRPKAATLGSLLCGREEAEEDAEEGAGRGEGDGLLSGRRKSGYAAVKGT